MGSLPPAFVPARLVGLAVQHACAFALTAGLPSRLRIPLNASVTLWEATAPVKLPTSHCPLYGVRADAHQKWYFTVPSTTPARAASKGPTYPTYDVPRPNGKL